MTKERIKEIIANCSGIAGLTEYERLSEKDFIEWFENNIQYNGYESRMQGKELIEYLRKPKVYSVFVEHESSIRSFCKIATTDYKKAKEAFDDMVEYFSNYCRKGTNFRMRQWPLTCCTTYEDCMIVECDEHQHIIHFDRFVED